MASIALLFWSLLGASSSAWAGDDVCTIQPAVVPDFAMADVNPNSATYGQTLHRDDFRGRVMVIYWAVST